MADNVNEMIDSLKQLLSSDDAAQKITEMMEALGVGEKEDEPIRIPVETQQPQQPQQVQDVQTPPQNPFASAINMDVVKNVLNNAGANDPRINLLKSIRPYMGEARLPKLDAATRILQFASLAGTLGIFKKKM